MPTGIGIPPDASGNGTRPQDVQRVTAAKYRNAGVIEGAEVTGRTDMSYDIATGAVLIDTGAGLATEVAIEPQTIAAPAAPSTGSATHHIYVKQLHPGSDGSSLAPVTVSTTAPTGNHVMLDRRVINAGATGTNSTTSNWDRVYAVPTSGTLGRLGGFVFTGTNPHTTGTFVVGTARFTCPTDRYVDLQVTETYSLGRSDGSSGGGYQFQSIQFKVYLDDVLIKTWECTISGVWETKQFDIIWPVTVGAHVVKMTVERQSENTAIPIAERYWMNRYGGAEKFNGTAINIWDRGLSK